MLNKEFLLSWAVVTVLIIACGNSFTQSFEAPEISTQVIPNVMQSLVTPKVSVQATLSTAQSPATPRGAAASNTTRSFATPSEAKDMNELPDRTFFPLGFMGAQDKGAFPRIAAGGFNIIHEFRSVQEMDAAVDYLTQADAMRLQVVQNMPACRAYAASQPYCEGVEVWSEGEWAEFISTLAAHDNLVAWFLPDEITDYDAAANLYAWVHAYDPHDRPVFGNPGTYQQSIISQFPAFTDFLWAACYPEYDKLPRRMR